MILESIVAYSTRRARWCPWFSRPPPPRGAPAAAALLPAAGLTGHVFLSEFCVGYRVSRVFRTVSDRVVYVIIFQGSHQASPRALLVIIKIFVVNKKWPHRLVFSCLKARFMW